MVHSLYHEGDHAELYYQIARAKAHDFGSADELAKAMFMTEEKAPKAAAQAFANKMEKTAPEFMEMKAHWENIYGKGGTDRARIINDMVESDREPASLNAEADAIHEKAMDSKAMPAERTQAHKDYLLKRGDVKQEQAKHNRNYALYENLSEETRAFTTEHKRAEWMKAAGGASEKRTRALQELERARADPAAARALRRRTGSHRRRQRAHRQRPGARRPRHDRPRRRAPGHERGDRSRDRAHPLRSSRVARRWPSRLRVELPATSDPSRN